MNFFLEKEEYLDCAKVRDLLEGKILKEKENNPYKNHLYETIFIVYRKMATLA